MTSKRTPEKPTASKKVAAKKAPPLKTSPPAKAKARKRPADKQTASMTLILDTTEQLMRREGYAAVTTRRVAREAGLKAPLIHYYFPTTDDLFLAVFRRAVGETQAQFNADFAGHPGIAELWKSYKNPDRTALLVEFMALANHRDAVREELALYTERYRSQRANMIEKILQTKKLKDAGGSVEGLMVIMVGIARTLIMEQGLGITTGHEEAEQLLESWLTQFDASN